MFVHALVLNICWKWLNFILRVGVWEAAKWVAKIRDTTCSRCSTSAILKTNMLGGHFGEGGLYGGCEETAYEYAFLIKVLRTSDHE